MRDTNLTLSSKRALEAFEKMVLARFTDEKMHKLVKQNKGGTFQLAASGHEMIGAVCALALESGKDWSCPYYRDQPFAIALGSDLTELFGVFLGRATKNHSGGRMMPYHFSHQDLRIICQSSVVGSQFLHAVGRAWAIKNLGKDEVVYVSAGDGATSQGDFHEALNFATIHALPVIFVIQDNGMAISVPQSEQTSGGSVAKMAQGYEGLTIHDVDGTDYEKLQVAMNSAVEKGRKNQGASLIVAHVPRLAAHSNSDDPRKYQESFDEQTLPDPIIRFEKWLVEQELATEDQLEKLRRKAFATVEEAAKAAEELPYPQKGSASQHVFAPFSPPISTLETISDEKITMMDGLNHALIEEMENDPYVVVFGQDVAHGKGGVFGVTRGLTDKFGDERCFNTPLAESTIIGTAIGMAMDGLHKPVVEIQFADYLWTAINQLFNEASSIHYRSNGEFDVPITVRMPCGGYIQGGPYHSQSIEGFLAHCPGLKVVIPSNAADAKGLLKTAIRDPNPVIFLEHKGLYRQQKFAARPEPTKEGLIPFGEASIIREGEDLTLVTYGMTVLMAKEIAEKLSYEGISVEVIDLRTIVPLDINTVLTSVKKTGKLIVAHEASLNCGFGAEVVARIAQDGFDYLDAPIKRIGALDCAVPYSKPLETEMLPQASELEAEIRSLARY
ncbi:MAG: 1-deoxy-D-xylulose-5-phosphate synthase [Chlamydiales bacterium]|nr:1-deoxy-D-xylulose-5-phosphate synthase [Chlamydiales bacterium]MCH9619929.1 1-deoxy-D-xylulose-5-phosphate synthase [Chlamydiales bacterium]MCH9622644.1 1-deoxy-D-xylulose-5-phosphate synthase [Chlamydiales bacterium]